MNQLNKKQNQLEKWKWKKNEYSTNIKLCSSIINWLRVQLLRSYCTRMFLLRSFLKRLL